MSSLPRSTKIARIYLAFSASEYFSASEAVLRRFYGDDGYAAISADYPAELRAQIQFLLTKN